MTLLSRRSWTRLALTGAAALTLPRPTNAQPTAARVPNGRRFLQYDVFTDRPHTGNQLAVFLDPKGLEVPAMHAMTRETRFSECTFVFPPEQAGTDIRLRIFGPGGELPFAGHPVIGSAFALADTGGIARGRTEATFGLGLGPTTVELEWKDGALAFAWMTQQRPVYGATLALKDKLAAALGLAPPAIRAELPVQEVSCGSTFCFVPLVSRAAVDQAEADRRAVDAVFKEAGLMRRGLFVFSTEPGADGGTAYSRMLGANEDPATGSASGPLGCYLVKHKLVPPERAGSMVSVQGVKMGRPSRIHIRIDVTGDDITRVRVGGQSVLVGEGLLRSA